MGWEINSKVLEAIQSHDYDKRELIIKSTFGSVILEEAIDYLNSCDDFEVPIQEIELTLVGVCTDICVISNALLLKAYYPEMKIVVDASCCAGSSPLRHIEALDIMESCQIDVINRRDDEFIRIVEKYSDD